MTVSRRDNHSTEFGLWLREQNEIDSRLGYVATNIDFMWQNYKTGEYLLIEEKRYNTRPKYFQKKMFQRIDNALKSDDLYRGFYYLIFEKTSPDDGKIFLSSNIMNENQDGRWITKEELILFLMFRQRRENDLKRPQEAIKPP